VIVPIQTGKDTLKKKKELKKKKNLLSIQRPTRGGGAAYDERKIGGRYWEELFAISREDPQKKNNGVLGRQPLRIGRPGNHTDRET